jgi:hypothetical protein
MLLETSADDYFGKMNLLDGPSIHGDRGVRSDATDLDSRRILQAFRS